jgi:hypothetical protein
MSATTDKTPPKFNALKHGLRSAAILLPGDDLEEFSRLRRELFYTYRPRTRDEAACVEAIASHQWRIARCRRWQAAYDAQTEALLFGGPNGLAEHICEKDSHRWIHKAMDCTLQESRLERLLCRTRDKLLLLQKLRRNNLIAGAVEREPIFWPSEFPADVQPGPAQGQPSCGEEDGQVGGNKPAGPPETEGLEANRSASPALTSPSINGEIFKYPERAAHPTGREQSGVEPAGRAALPPDDGRQKVHMTVSPHLLLQLHESLLAINEHGDAGHEIAQVQQALPEAGVLHVHPA